MDHSDAGARRRTTEVPAKPEAGLAEWTSRIKAMQRQVDDDEETETRRLEEEIAASRLARMRRSTGRGTSTDLSNTDIAKSLKDNSPSPVSANFGTVAESAGGKQQNQEDTLRKLMGERQARKSEGIPSSSAAAPMSLAAFIGGRATGPRLNKQTPQQDAHDPTQFEQRTITSPHPVFGRGGVAMPGMVGRTRARNEDDPSPKVTSFPSTPKGQSTAPSLGGMSTAKASMRGADIRRTPSPEKSTATSSVTDWQSVRQRTLSNTAPTVKSPSPAPVKESFTSKPSPSPRPTSYNPVAGDYLSSKSTPSGRSHTPTGQPSRAAPSRTHSVSPLPSTPPSRQPTSPSISSPKSPITSSSPGLAKPIQPTPRKSLQGPQISFGQTASPTFLRSPAAKDPTPSISRLQGRGFVQNMVRASTQLEASTQASSSSSTYATPEKDKDALRKGSVLDRWQFNSTNSSAPIIAPKPVPLRKSRTVDPSDSPMPTSPVPTPFNPTGGKRDTPEKTLKSMASLPSITQATSPDKVPRPTSAKNDMGSSNPPISQKRGLGSSMTMISYIKPLKTGDNPPTNVPPSRPSSRASRSRPTTPSPDVDEMGIRVRSHSRPRSVGGGGPDAENRQAGASAGNGVGKPLSHPTKERARKPRRAKTAVMDSPLRPKSSGQNNVLSENKAQISTRATHIPQGAVSPRLSAPSTADAPKTTSVNISRSPTPSPPLTGASRRVHFPLEIQPVAPPQDHEKPPRSPATPIRHNRIPSTGNRATVMDVAQALSEHEEQARKFGGDGSPTPPKVEELPVETPEVAPTLDVKSVVSNWGVGNGGPSPIPMEKRKSSYEKYSAFVLPPLMEEKTPVTSPANSIARRVGMPTNLQEGTEPTSESTESANGQVDSSQSRVSAAPIAPALVPEPLVPEPRPDVSVVDSFAHFEHVDEALPKVDIVPLLNFKPSVYKPHPDEITISVDVMNVVGDNATPLNSDSRVFHDTETLVVIYRFKAKSSGLVNTKVWAWYGSKAQAGEREEKKLQELARRYNSPLVNVKQNAEPVELIYVLGCQLATRQGTRAHWSRENTAMHLVRSSDGVIFIDELELNIRNLCSGFSYCLSLLETFYVWHGAGATPDERHAALLYAHSLASHPESVIELTEGADDEDEMFWLILGEGDYAKADHWKWKPALSSLSTRAWLIDADNSKQAFASRSTIGVDDDLHSHVYLLDCIWEFFVLVGSEARGKRKDIRLALHLAQQLSAASSSSRPFRPTVHVLILPSQIPADLRLTFRELDEYHLNRGAIPDHMNLLPASEAIEHLKKTSWERSLLKDDSMLPLGLQSGQ